MSTRCSVYYGPLGHLYWEQGESEYQWDSPGDRYWFRLPFRRPWRWLDRSPRVLRWLGDYHENSVPAQEVIRRRQAGR